MWHPDPKSILASRTVWSALIAFAAAGATAYLGHSVDVAAFTGMTPDQLATALADIGGTLYATGGVGAVASIGALVFRVLAKRPLTLAGSADPGGPPRRPSVTLPTGVFLALVLLGSCTSLDVGSVAAPRGVASVADVKAMVDACNAWADALDDATKALTARTLPLDAAVGIGQLKAEVQPTCLDPLNPTPARVATVAQDTGKLRLSLKQLPPAQD